MSCLINALSESTDYKNIINSIKKGVTPVDITGPSDSQKAHTSYFMCKSLNLNGMYIAYNEIQARKMHEDFTFFFGEDVLFFPKKEIMLYDVEAKSNDITFQRIGIFERLIKNDYKFIVTSAEAIIQKLVCKKIFEENILKIDINSTINLLDLSKNLITIGYERVSIVEGKGQFVVKGGIVDIFPVNIDYAVRIELFGDEIDSMRKVDTISQRSTEKIENLTILPAQEVIYSETRKKTIVNIIECEIAEFLKKLKQNNNVPAKEIKEIESKLNHDLEKIKCEYYFPGMDKFLPYIFDEPTDLFDYVCEEAIVFIDEPARLEKRIENINFEHSEICKELLQKGRILPRSFDVFLNLEDLKSKFDKHKLLLLNSIASSGNTINPVKSFSIQAKSLNSYNCRIDLLLEDIRYWKSIKNKIIILSGSKGRGERLVDTLRTEHIEAIYSENDQIHIQKGQVIVTFGSLNTGFEYPSNGLVVVSDKTIFGEDKKSKKTSNKKAAKKLTYLQTLI